MKRNVKTPRSPLSKTSVARGTLAVLVLLAATLVTLVAGAGELPEERLEEALAAQYDLITSNPGDADLHSDLGNLLELSGRADAAANAYRVAISLDPTHITAHYNLALLEHSRGELRQARELYESVVEHEPAHAWAHYQLGRLAETRGKDAEAVAHYGRAFTLNSDLAFADTNPHVLDNALVTEALLATQATVPSDDAPRIYKQPTRIGAILAPRPVDPEPDARSDSSPTPAATTTAGGGFGGVTTPHTDEPESTTLRTDGGRVPRSRSARPPGASPRSPARRADGSEDDRTLSGDDLRDLGRINQAEDTNGTSAVGTRRQNVTSPRRPRGATAPAPRLPQPVLTPQPQPSPDSAPPTGGRFRPGSRSSAQLDLEVVPLATPRDQARRS